MSRNVKLDWNGEAVKLSLRQAALRLLHGSVRIIQAEAKRLLSVAGSGRVNGKKAGPRRASAPGEPPRKQTGQGRASVAVEVDSTTMEGRVGPTAKYMAWLELGTKRVAPRPWLRPAVAASQAKIMDLAKSLGKLLK